MYFKIEKSDHIKYVIRFPDDYKAGDKVPVIIFLHGAGSRGDDIDLLVGNPFHELTNRYLNFPFITVAPQCYLNTWFDMFEQLKKFVCKIAQESFADSQRIYVIGASMGGYAAWQLAMSLPELFAAVVPICGGGMYWNAARLANVPIWAFHGEKDTTVLKEETIKMVNAVNNCGGKAKLTVYPENGHNAWSDTYNNPEVFQWLLSNTKNNSTTITEEYKDSNIYG